MASFLDSQRILFRSTSVQSPLITLQSCRGRRRDVEAVRRRDDCNVIAPPCLKGLGCLILIDPTGEVSRSCSWRFERSTQGEPDWWGEEIAAYLPLQSIGWHHE